jgi:phosphomannomutase
MYNFLFDVDGTLTPARQPIDKQFGEFFLAWVLEKKNQGHRVLLVTGSDRKKTVEQIGKTLWTMVTGSYQNCGNSLYVAGKKSWESRWQMGSNLEIDLISLIVKSKWYGTARNNIEERTGMVNVSTIGRSCTQEQRKAYYEWDLENKERINIVNILSHKYNNIDLAIGGEISIDIYEKGKDKSQVIDRISGNNIFFGDKCFQGGNDHKIALKSDRYHHVDGWQETKDILEKLYG